MKVHSTFFFWNFVNVSVSNFPIGHQAAAHHFHKEQRGFAKTGGAHFPWAPIKTSFGKVTAFSSSLSHIFLLCHIS